MATYQTGYYGYDPAITTGSSTVLTTWHAWNTNTTTAAITTNAWTNWTTTAITTTLPTAIWGTWVDNRTPEQRAADEEARRVAMAQAEEAAALRRADAEQAVQSAETLLHENMRASAVLGNTSTSSAHSTADATRSDAGTMPTSGRSTARASG